MTPTEKTPAGDEGVAAATRLSDGTSGRYWFTNAQLRELHTHALALPHALAELMECRVAAVALRGDLRVARADLDAVRALRESVRPIVDLCRGEGIYKLDIGWDEEQLLNALVYAFDSTSDILVNMPPGLPYELVMDSDTSGRVIVDGVVIDRVGRNSDDMNPRWHPVRYRGNCSSAAHAADAVIRQAAQRGALLQVSYD